jgi:hypothetical protein
MRAKVVLAVIAVGFGLSLSLATPAFAADYTTPSAPTLTTSTSSGGAGLAFTVSGCNYAPNESITITLQNSTSVVLATVTANSSGCFSSTVTIPSNTAPGAYTISAGGLAFTTFTVTSVAPVVATTTPLAITGADIAALSGVGAIALALGGMLILTGRRRRRTTGG